MSEAIAFDTHRFVKHLTENGFTEQQAEVLADEQVSLLNSNLATQADVAAIHQDIDALRQETQANIATVRQEIDALRQETKANIDALRQETKANIDACARRRRPTLTPCARRRRPASPRSNGILNIPAPGDEGRY